MGKPFGMAQTASYYLNGIFVLEELDQIPTFAVCIFAAVSIVTEAANKLAI